MSQLKSENNYFNHFLARSINLTLTSLVSFLIALSLSFLLRLIFNFSITTMIVIIFIFSLFLSPIMNKFRFTIGYTIEDSYFKWLERNTDKWIKKK